MVWSCILTASVDHCFGKFMRQIDHESICVSNVFEQMIGELMHIKLRLFDAFLKSYGPLLEEREVGGVKHVFFYSIANCFNKRLFCHDTCSIKKCFEVWWFLCP